MVSASLWRKHVDGVPIRSKEAVQVNCESVKTHLCRTSALVSKKVWDILIQNPCETYMRVFWGVRDRSRSEMRSLLRMMNDSTGRVPFAVVVLL